MEQLHVISWALGGQEPNTLVGKPADCMELYKLLTSFGNTTGLLAFARITVAGDGDFVEEYLRDK